MLTPFFKNCFQAAIAQYISSSFIFPRNNKCKNLNRLNIGGLYLRLFLWFQ